MRPRSLADGRSASPLLLELLMFALFAARPVGAAEPAAPAPPGRYLVGDEGRFTPVAEQSVPWDVPSLKEAFKDEFLIGTALDARRFQGQASMEIAIATTHFNAITPENSMKPMALQPTEGHFTFANADRVVELAEKSGATPIGHCLVWHSQTPRWFFQGPDGQPAGRDLALGRMRQHIATVVGHYKGRVKQWDVVNEALSDTPGQRLRPSPWLKAVGEDYIAEAFRAAHEADPDALLIYNDYGLEQPGKRRKALQLLKALIEQKVPVQAVGIQGHWRLESPDLAEVEESIRQFAGLGLKVMITELDIGVLPTRYQGADISRRESKSSDQGSLMNPYVQGLPDTVARQQAERYRQAFAMFLRHKDVIGRVTFWGVDDAHSWLNHFPIRGRTDYPLLFDRQGRPKAAFFAVTKAAQDASAAAPKSWTADNGNGTYSNPLFYEEFEDPDVIRVGEDYYLAGTTMHMNPAVLIMHSSDLVNWELAGYCLDRLDLGPAYRLEGGRNIYGRGIWAPCLRYHDGMFYVFTNVNGAGLQVFRSRSISGPWQRNQLPGRHDPSVLFDDDGKIYLISGGHSPYPIEEVAPDLKSFVPGVRHQLVGRMGEGHHLYKIQGKYYDVSALPGGNRDQMIARADSIDGPWTVERMVQGESLGVPSRGPRRPNARPNPNDRGLTLHQGGLVDTPSGEWWSIIMQDHGSIGRMVDLVPITWDHDFPIIGLPGNLRKAPNTWVKPNTGHTQAPRPAFTHDDNFNSGKLNPDWQWNHVPDDSRWSLTEKLGVLRLHSLPATDLYSARNSLCQRPPGPESIMTVELDASGLVDGDTAGLALLSNPYAWIGVVKSAQGMKLQMYDQTNRRTTTGPDNPPQHLRLRVACNFDTDEAIFSWSADGKQFTPVGDPFTMTFQLRTFQGVRPSLFNFNTSGQPGGYADFDNFTVVEPRASGLERRIPLGKTITLSSGADGSFLALGTKDLSLVNIPSDSPIASTANVRFQVADLGKGRVALKASNGRFVSAGANGVVLKDLVGAAPGDAESFQWVNLMRGDTMLMSLTNHRYLATQPNNPGPVTVSAVGPRPDRKDGACFQWKAVD